ncbi:adhesion G-protein coupled receptor G4-like isoform X3 [Hydra vulgaris]|uniref:Adhesion G-protein coupled receptor G4-like isoform X3 n=1 Tax=Hydra vulgaris TaxID=6087 RepID=A0ABM4CQQ8_HYDVU
MNYLASFIMISLVQFSIQTINGFVYYTIIHLCDCTVSGCNKNEVCEDSNDVNQQYDCKCNSNSLLENGKCIESLSNWSSWSACSATCQNNGDENGNDDDPVKIRNRTCLRFDGCLNAELTEIMVCDLEDCKDCRITGCEKNKICVNLDETNEEMYYCKCDFNTFWNNGTCINCTINCTGLKKCKYDLNHENECACIPNHILVKEKCTAASSKWASWSSWDFKEKTPNAFRTRNCTLFIDANTNETQNCRLDNSDYLSSWSVWSDCSNGKNRTRSRACADTYFGENCTGAIEEISQSCPEIILQLNKTWNNRYMDSTSESYKNLFSWFSGFTKEFEKWFKRFTPYLLCESNLFIEKYFVFGSFNIWYSVEPKNLTRSCKEIESSIASQDKVFDCNISLESIKHSDCCFSKIYDPLDAFIIKYFTGLEYFNLSLAYGYSAINCHYNKSKIYNASCVIMDSDESQYTTETSLNIAMWDYYEIYKCPAENTFSQFLLDLNQTITSKNADIIAANLSTVLNNNTNIKIADFRFITDIITRVIQASTMPLNVTKNIVSVVNTLLNQNTTLINEANMQLKVSKELLSQLDKMAAKQYTNVTISTESLAFSSYLNEKNNSNIYIYSENNNNLSVIISSKDPENGSESYLPYITLPSQLFFNNKKTLVYSFIYKDVDLFLNLENQTGIINSVVLSATLKNVVVNESKNPILIRFSKSSNASGNTSCGFFDTKKETWSTVGCSISKSSLLEVLCECNHLTNFALILNVAQSVETSSNVFLEVITWIGCGLSIAGLFLTIVSYSVFSKLRMKLAPKILVSLCVSLICTLIIFLASETPRKPSLSCKVVASLLQFFVLSTFFWMAVEGLNLYRMFVKVFPGSSSTHKFFLRASALAWGIPLIFTIATAASKPDSLGPSHKNNKNPQVCVVQGYSFYFGILLPICVIMTGNVCVLFFVLRGVSVNSNLHNKVNMKKKARIAFACSTLLGLTWIFAILAVGKATAVFQWLFCIFNSLQGFFVFLFYTVGNKKVKEEWMFFMEKKFVFFKNLSGKSQNTTSKDVSTNTLETKLD